MRSILALASKDLKLLMRDPVGFFFVFFFPLIFAIFFGVIFSGEGGGMGALSLAVVDEDGTDASRKFVKKLDNAEELAVTMADREQAVSLVRQGKRTAYVILPSGFEDGFDRIFTGEGLHIEAGVDPSRKAESGMLQGVLTQYAFQMLQDLFMDRDAMRKQTRKALDAVMTADDDMGSLTRTVLDRYLQALNTFLDELPKEEGDDGDGTSGVFPGSESWQPIQVEVNSIARDTGGLPKTSFDITYPQAIAWVLLGCSAAFGISLVTERTRGTLLRLRSTPIRLGEILAGKAVACFATIIAASALLFLIFFVAFGVRPDSYLYLIMSLTSASLAFVGIMMMLSVLGKTEAAAGGIGWAVLLIFAMVGGGMVPLIAMPSWMQTLSNISFVKWSILAVEGAVWRNFSFGEMIRPCGILIAIGLVCFFAGVRLFRVTVD